MPIARAVCLWLSALLLCAVAPAASPTGATLQVGSKRFTESYLLGEIVAQTAQRAGATAQHRQGLGNTAVVFEALKTGAIDVYPEYLGTIAAEILKQPRLDGVEALRAALAPQGLGITAPLGFSNGYALAMPAVQAQRLGIQRLSDLKAHPELALGLSHEFLGRQDGWPGLAARYGLAQRPTGIDHSLAYEALASGRIAATDIYTTDAKIATLGLRVLDDDLGFFPRYDAVLLYRLDVPQRFPVAWQALAALEGRIGVAQMIEMNGQAELQGRSFADVARGFLAPATPAAAAQAGLVQRLFADDLGRLTAQHLLLVVVAVLAACALGIPLGAAAAALPRVEQPVMAVVGLLQTVPSLALLAMLIPLLGRIGTVPALVALALYALLPIVRNTATGLQQVPAGLRDAGTALGLTAAQRWRSIDLPLAAPVLLAGIKTAAVISVGTATIAAFIGAGGYGERIVTGLALNDHTALLAGAIPAAVLALLTQLVFELGERWLRREE
ncbi:ABC transporter permease subunit [Rhizobacter sp. J219]|uniref:ABC transporter permease/substrate-binding protein n=1 Tax=Rhizobacter sp. J219 TaxID=2898430 RepID=UPI002150DF54|nr:glycine betaine ABC transporter substrate-binding protein [Rhizobacter sp. J219]MCR5885087.1 ABC transporter permease subunit [Rhizobacter sp. J219]